MMPITPLNATHKAPENGVIHALDRMFHHEGPLTASHLRDLIAISQAVADLYNAADMLGRMNADEVQETENMGGEDPAKLARVHQARHALARVDDLTIHRIDPEDVVDQWPEGAAAPKNKPHMESSMSSSSVPNTTESQARVRVYDFPNGFREEAERMYGTLRAEGFTPAWDSGKRDDGEFRSGITLPVREVPQLHELQRMKPATWGNAPEVEQSLRESQAEMARQLGHDRLRRAALTPEQENWIEVLHIETHLNGSTVLELNEKLHELAAQHFVLSVASVNDGLSETQERALEGIEGAVQDVLASVPGIQGAMFQKDPRGMTVGILFASGAADSSAGCYKVPLNLARVRALLQEGPDFWEAVAGVPKNTP